MLQHFEFHQSMKDWQRFLKYHIHLISALDAKKNERGSIRNKILLEIRMSTTRNFFLYVQVKYSSKFTSYIQSTLFTTTLFVPKYFDVRLNFCSNSNLC